MSLLDKSILEIKEEGVTSELVKEAVGRAKEKQEDLNAFVTITDGNSKDTDGVLKGIPFAIKDNYSTAGILSTASSNILKDYVPFYDATVYEKLLNAGAVSIGKTVLDELAMGGTSTTGHTGAVHNPWNPQHLIGGSSGGSAAAVASGIVPFAIGSDTGDSVIRPAALGGVVGFKPTWGKISRFGLFPFACSLDTVAYFTRSVKDAALLTDVLKGQDGKDMTVYESDEGSLLDQITGDIKGKKLFVIEEVINRDNYKDCLDDDLVKTLDSFDKVIEKARELGAEVEVVPFGMDLLKAIYPTYMVISCAEATSNNSNLTGIIFGPRGEGNTPDEIMFDARTKGFSELIKRRFVIGSYALQKENQEKFFLNAGRARRMIVDRTNELFEKYDGMLIPTTGGPAPKAESENIDRMNFRSLVIEEYVKIANFGGFPSITVPSDTVDGLPIAITVIGKVKDEKNVLNFGYALEQEFGFEYLNQRGEK